jgi:uncharacterized damage-inducible protein DinB
MKRTFSLLAVMALALVGLALARGYASSTPAPADSSAAGPTVESIAPLYEMVKGYIVAAAEQMPEENYGYQPTSEVRTFGQIVGHVAMAQYWFCNGATGKTEEPGNWEELTSKAELVEVIKGSFDYCDEAYAMDDAMAMGEVDLWGETGTRLWVLSYNLTHDWEHYGNLVTYMRANGQVPPSSQGGM